jgi:hypothetical protein
LVAGELIVLYPEPLMVERLTLYDVAPPVAVQFS